MKKWKRYFFRGLLLITVLFILQSRFREYFFDDTVAKQVLTDSLYVEQVLTQQSLSEQRNIVPCGWYEKDGVLSPTIAGLCDGAYQSCVAIKDIAVFIAKYKSDFAYQVEINTQIGELLENKAEIAALTGKSLKDFGIELSGKQGSTKAEYAYGKMLFEVVILVTGVSELSEGANLLRNSTSKLSNAFGKLSALRLANIAKLCPSCAEIFKTAQTLRTNLVGANYASTIKLLEADFLKSGKTWEVFIKDYEAHHIIPVNLLDESKALQFYYNNGGKLNFNSIENGILVKRLRFSEGVHAKHGAYSDAIAEKLDEAYKKVINLNISNQKKVQFIDNQIRIVIEDTRKQIIEKCIGGNMKINDVLR